MAPDRPQEGNSRPRDRYPRPVVVHVPPPRLHRLRRVVPIGQTQEHHGVAVLALVLEVYEAGFVATFQIQSMGAGPDLGDADDAERSPRLALSATDNRGGHYSPIVSSSRSASPPD